MTSSFSGTVFALARVSVLLFNTCFFLSMLVGNDFIPHLPHLDIGHGSLSLLLDIYKKMVPAEKDFLTDKATINLDFFERFMAKVAENEFPYFQHRGNKEGNPKMAKKNSYRKVVTPYLLHYTNSLLSCP